MPQMFDERLSVVACSHTSAAGLDFAKLSMTTGGTATRGTCWRATDAGKAAIEGSIKCNRSGTVASHAGSSRTKLATEGLWGAIDLDAATTEGSTDCQRSGTPVSRSSEIFNTAVSWQAPSTQRQVLVLRTQLAQARHTYRQVLVLRTQLAQARTLQWLEGCPQRQTTGADAAYTACVAGAGAMHSSTGAGAAFPAGAR